MQIRCFELQDVTDGLRRGNLDFPKMPIGKKNFIFKNHLSLENVGSWHTAAWR